jgi:hypothetical protein
MSILTGTSADVARTLDRRFWLTAAIGTLVGALALGVPSAVIPNPFFTRMTPTEPFNVLVWVLSAPLTGLLLATYVAKGGISARDIHADAGSGRATLGSVAAYLAIGCPLCNKIVVATLGVSGALNVFGPAQPFIGATSVALLAATLAWRLRMRARGCARCSTDVTSGPVTLPLG